MATTYSDSERTAGDKFRKRKLARRMGTLPWITTLALTSWFVIVVIAAAAWIIGG